MWNLKNKASEYNKEETDSRIERTTRGYQCGEESGKGKTEAGD